GRVFQLARHLRARGLAPEEVVGVGVPRSGELVVAVLAIMVAGGAFVPVDPAWPEERQRQVVDEAGARLIVTAEVVDRAGDESTEPLDLPIDAGQLAYVIFTSGSTG